MPNYNFFILTFFFNPAIRNSFLYSLYLEEGTFTIALEGIPFSAVLLSVFNFLDLMIIVFKFLQFLNALLPIVVTPVPITTFFRLVQPLKAFFPMVVMLFPIVIS